MKQNFGNIVFAGVTLTMFLLSCSSSDGNKHREKQVTKMSYHKQAAKVKSDGGAPEKYIALQQEAVEAMRRGEAQETPVEILSQMGYFYFRSGDYLQSLTYLQEAADSMYNQPQDTHDVNAGVKLYGNISNLYNMMGLYKEALARNAKAMELCEEGDDNSLIPDLWCMRSVIYESTNKPDSAMLCLLKAIRPLTT